MHISCIKRTVSMENLVLTRGAVLSECSENIGHHSHLTFPPMWACSGTMKAILVIEQPHSRQAEDLASMLWGCSLTKLAFIVIEQAHSCEAVKWLWWSMFSRPFRKNRPTGQGLNFSWNSSKNIFLKILWIFPTFFSHIIFQGREGGFMIWRNLVVWFLTLSNLYMN